MKSQRNINTYTDPYIKLTYESKNSNYLHKKMRKRVSQSHSNFSKHCILTSSSAIDDNYSILKEILIHTGKERPKKCPVTTVTNMATSFFCSCVISRNLPKIRLAYQDYVAKYCWYVYEQCNNSNYKAKYTTSSNINTGKSGVSAHFRFAECCARVVKKRMECDFCYGRGTGGGPGHIIRPR